MVVAGKIARYSYKTGIKGIHKLHQYGGTGELDKVEHEMALQKLKKLDLRGIVLLKRAGEKGGSWYVLSCDEAGLELLHERNYTNYADSRKRAAEWAKSFL